MRSQLAACEISSSLYGRPATRSPPPPMTQRQRKSKGRTPAQRAALSKAHAAAVRKRAAPPAPAPPAPVKPAVVLPAHLRPQRGAKGRSAAQRANVIVMTARRRGTLDALLASAPPGPRSATGAQLGVKVEEGDAHVKIEET
jgi:hypothetical protein